MPNPRGERERDSHRNGALLLNIEKYNFFAHEFQFSPPVTTHNSPYPSEFPFLKHPFRCVSFRFMQNVEALTPQG